MYACWPYSRTNFDSKENHGKKSFSNETKASISFIPLRRMCLWCQIMKRKEIIMWICVCPNRWTNINSKNGGKRNFSYETKVLISSIRMRRMYLWCPISKKKEIIMWISVYPNWKMNFNSKNDGKRNFSYETKASISFILIREMCLWCPIMKKK